MRQYPICMSINSLNTKVNKRKNKEMKYYWRNWIGHTFYNAPSKLQANFLDHMVMVQMKQLLPNNGMVFVDLIYQVPSKVHLNHLKNGSQNRFWTSSITKMFFFVFKMKENQLRSITSARVFSWLTTST